MERWKWAGNEWNLICGMMDVGGEWVESSMWKSGKG